MTTDPRPQWAAEADDPRLAEFLRHVPLDSWPGGPQPVAVRVIEATFSHSDLRAFKPDPELRVPVADQRSAWIRDKLIAAGFQFEGETFTPAARMERRDHPDGYGITFRQFIETFE